MISASKHWLPPLSKERSELKPDDAAAMLRTCLAAAETDGSVCVFLEPIALYHERDALEPRDGGWLARYRFGSDEFASWRWAFVAVIVLAAISTGRDGLMRKKRRTRLRP